MFWAHDFTVHGQWKRKFCGLDWSCVIQESKLTVVVTDSVIDRLFVFLSSGVVHDPLPFLLPLALRGRLHAPVQWQRLAYDALGQWVQVSTSLFNVNIVLFSTLSWCWTFCPLHSKFDLYTKSTDMPDVEKLKPYYQSLIDKYCPGILKWWNRQSAAQQWKVFKESSDKGCSHM